MMSTALPLASSIVSLAFTLTVLDQFSAENPDYLRWVLEKP